MRAAAVLSDEELCMLEQLCYLVPEVASAAGVETFSGITDRDAGLTVGEILAVFDEDAIGRLRVLGDEEAGRSCISGREWADILQYVKESPLKDLVVKDTLSGGGDVSLAVTYEQPGMPDEAIVAFKGTTGAEEWVDNIEGMNVSDTPAQQEALLYIEEQPYKHLTVTGHSKGANKAMYVTVLCPRVYRCAAFDGQGFSEDFIDRYGAEINERAGLVNSYSLRTDFIHILLFPLPGSRQIFCEGFGVKNAKQHHSPNSFFRLDAAGSLLTDAAGRPVIVSAAGGQALPEDPSMTVLHRFCAFLMNNASDEDRNAIAGYLETVIPLAMSGEDSGTKKEGILRVTGENTEAAAAVIAWLAVFMHQYHYDADTVDGILQSLGLDTLDELCGFSLSAEEIDRAGLPVSWEVLAEAGGLDPEGLHAGLSTVLDVILRRLNNGKRDSDIQGTLAFLDLFISLRAGAPLRLAEIWKAADRKTGEISAAGGAGNKAAGTFRVRDFSDAARTRLDEDLRQTGEPEGLSLDGWAGYEGEPWFSELNAGTVTRGLRMYAEAAGMTAAESRRQAEDIFRCVHEADARYAEKILAAGETLRKIGQTLAGIGGG